MHGLGFTLSFLAFAVACAAFAREAARYGRWLSVVTTAVAAAAALTLAVAPGNSTVAVRDLVAAGILWAWIGGQSLRLLSHLTPRTEPQTRQERRIVPAQGG